MLPTGTTPRGSAAAVPVRRTFCAARPVVSSVMATPGCSSPLQRRTQPNLGSFSVSTPSMPTPS
ncbi:MAG: hypothetical protein ACK56I_19400, partial [bacterium]